MRFPAARINTNTNDFLTVFCENTSDPNREPITPPTTTAIANGIKTLLSRTNCPEIELPIKPEAEFTQMKAAATPAVVFASPHPNIKIIGDRKIPPPTPIIPLNKPITIPIIAEM